MTQTTQLSREAPSLFSREDLPGVREHIAQQIAETVEWTEERWVAVGDRVAALAVLDQSVETTRIAFAWARHRPSTTTVASPLARKPLWDLLCASASLPPTIFQSTSLADP